MNDKISVCTRDWYNWYCMLYRIEYFFNRSKNYFLIIAKFFVRFLQLEKELQNLKSIKKNIFRLGYKKNDFGKYKFYVKNILYQRKISLYFFNDK